MWVFLLCDEHSGLVCPPSTAVCIFYLSKKVKILSDGGRIVICHQEKKKGNREVDQSILTDVIMVQSEGGH